MHIETNDAAGHSKKSLGDAIANAIGTAMADFDGEHKMSLTVVIDGYEFDGQEYRVKVRVIVLDLTKAELEHTRHVVEDKEHEKEEELSRELVNEMTAAIYNKHSYDSQVDEFSHALHHYLDHIELHHANIEEFTLMAHPATHDHLNMEMGLSRKPTIEQDLSFHHHYDKPEPFPTGEK